MNKEKLLSWVEGELNQERVNRYKRQMLHRIAWTITERKITVTWLNNRLKAVTTPKKRKVLRKMKALAKAGLFE